MGGRLNIYGGVGDGVAAATCEVGHLARIPIGQSRGSESSESTLFCTVLFTPCHTPGHISFYFDANRPEKNASGETRVASGEISAGVTVGGENSTALGTLTSENSALLRQPMVFTGDTMFVGGCGNFNGGTPEQMHHAMVGILGQLRADTLVFCGHEYTRRNLQFALEVCEPANDAVRQKAAWAARCGCTVPSTIAEEWQTNPFLRLGSSPAIQKVTGEPANEGPRAIAKVRRLKDEWGRKN